MILDDAIASGSRKTTLANNVMKDQAQRSGSKNTCMASGLKLGSGQSAPRRREGGNHDLVEH